MGQRATSLGAKPSLVFLVGGGCFSFLCLILIASPVFPLKKGIFVCFSVSPLVFSWYFPPLFHFLFLCLSLVLFFISYFIYFLLYFACLFFMLFSLVSLLLFHERTTSNIKCLSLSFINPFCFGGFAVFFFFQISFPKLCFSLLLSFVFVQHPCFLLKRQVKTHTHTHTHFWLPVLCNM